MPGRTVNNISGNASRKRNRREDGDDGQDIVDVHKASSSLRHESRKRARTSGASTSKRTSNAARHEFPDSPSTDEDVDMDEVERNDELSATQYEIMRDDGFKHLEHADEDDKRATQRIQRRNQLQKNRTEQVNQAAENGIIESIECVNFMCHERLSVTLGPLLNFIVGENGSGKSAVLTAITLCLGGKASSTNRGGSLKNFVKEGRTQSQLTVRIKNQGNDAYQPDLYGDTIVVERYFTAKGTSGFKVKSATGRTISTKKADVDEVVEYYCLQVDNPLNVLSQDNARQFLNAASAQTKYKFFLQGVQLQQLDDDYRVIQDYLDASENREDDLQARVDHAQKEFDTAKRDYELVLQHDSMRQKARLLRKQLIWAQVTREEEKLAQLDEDILAKVGEIAGADQLIKDKEQILANIDEKVEQAKADLDAVEKEAAELEERMEEANRNYEAAKKTLFDLQRDERDAKQRAANAKKEMKEYEQKIREEAQRLEAANGEAHGLKQEELSAARAKEQEVQQEIEHANQIQPDIAKRQRDAEDKRMLVIKEIEQKRGEITSMERKIQDCSQGHGRLYDGYEANVPQLLGMIQDDSGFEQKPVGPMGAHIQVLKPIWSSILEKQIGQNLSGFIVTNKRDQARLSDMMKRLKIHQCPILISAATAPINTRGSEPDDQFDTILRILNIDNPLVRNQLIIHQRIEQILLIEKQEDAERIMMHSGPVPRNVTACFHLFEGKRGWGVNLRVTPHSVSSGPIEPNRNQKPRLQTDSGRELPFLKESLVQLQNELRDLDAKKRGFDQNIQRCKSELIEQRKSANQRQRRVREVQVEIRSIQEELDSFDGADGRLETLRGFHEASKTEMNQYGEQYGTLAVAKQNQNEVTEDAKRWKDEVNGNREDLKSRLNKAADKHKRLSDSRLLILGEKNDAHHEFGMRKEEHESLERKKKRQETTVRDFVAEARENCERVHIPEGETPEMVEKKLKSLQKSLDDFQKRIGRTDDQIMAKAREMKEALDNIQKAAEQTHKENRGLKETLSNRLDKWRAFQRYISSNSRANFMYLLSERQFRGSLKLDHENHKLEVAVEPDSTRAKASARKTTTLSGGEKSFSSICLLLAIWEAMGSPLRCLDEFDVFMDNVNRAISTNMLISAARNSVGRQYILITPNAIEGRATVEKDVKIIRLTDPRQRTLV